MLAISIATVIIGRVRGPESAATQAMAIDTANENAAGREPGGVEG